MKPVGNIQTRCRFCGFTIWVPADLREPTCEDCDELASAAFDESYGVELTLRPITTWETYGKEEE